MGILFWNNHVLRQVPPPYIEEGDLIIESVRRHFGPANTDLPPIALTGQSSHYLLRFLELQQAKSEVEASVEQIDQELQRMKGLIVAELGAGCSATCDVNGTPYLVTYNPVRKPTVTKENLIRLRAQYPDIYNEYVSISESRRFYVKERREEVA